MHIVHRTLYCDCQYSENISFRFLGSTVLYLANVTFTRANVRQCHEMYIFFWRSKHFFLFFLCMRWWFTKAFHHLIQFLTWICFVGMTYQLWKCLLKLSSSLHVGDWAIFFCRPLVACRENAQELTFKQVTSDTYEFSKSRRLPVSIFNVKFHNRWIRAFRAGYHGRIFKIRYFKGAIWNGAG